MDNVEVWSSDVVSTHDTNLHWYQKHGQHLDTSGNLKILMSMYTISGSWI